MSEIKFEIIKKIGVLSKSASGWSNRTCFPSAVQKSPPCAYIQDAREWSSSVMIVR
jgi:hypothetical protein